MDPIPTWTMTWHVLLVGPTVLFHMIGPRLVTNSRLCHKSRRGCCWCTRFGGAVTSTRCRYWTSVLLLNCKRESQRLGVPCWVGVQCFLQSWSGALIIVKHFLMKSLTLIYQETTPYIFLFFFVESLCLLCNESYLYLHLTTQCYLIICP